MSFITNLTRTWLTRSSKPFVFKNEYDEKLEYEECENLGLYIHIPFCRKICAFCPYCKTVYREELCDAYIEHLLREIRMVGGQMKGKEGEIQKEGRKKVTSLYFGGGTPALAAGRIKEIIDVVSEYFEITEGIGLELHPDNVTIPVLRTLKDAGVTKISIGIQSFRKKYQDILGRSFVDVETMA